MLVPTMTRPPTDVPVTSGPVQSHQAAAVILGRVRAVTPGCRAVSLGSVQDGLLHTVSATEPLASALDATQYIDGGPSPMTARYGTRVEARLVHGSDAAAWGALGAVGRAVDVRSVLSVPIASQGAVAGTLTLYIEDTDAVEQHFQTLIGDIAGLASDAVRASAEPLQHRLATALLPEPARDQNAIDWAISLVAGQLDTDAAVAALLFRRAATRSGLSDSVLAYHLTDWLPVSQSC